MAGLDQETRDMILDTLKKYAERKLTPEYLLKLDHEDRFPHEVLQELYDPSQLGCTCFLSRRVRRGWAAAPMTFTASPN
jgi:hypothetical protein